MQKYNLVIDIFSKYKTASSETVPYYNFIKEALTIQDWNKQTILHICVDNNHIDLVEAFLRDYQCDPLLREGNCEEIN